MHSYNASQVYKIEDFLAKWSGGGSDEGPKDPNDPIAIILSRV